MKNKIALLDVDSMFFTIVQGHKVLDSFGKPIKENGKFVYEEKTLEEVKNSADILLRQLFTVTKCTHYIGFIKGVNTITNKLIINPEYKQNRKQEKPKLWDFVKTYLMEKWKIYEANNYEVDDYIINLKRFQPESFICAIDSDILGTEGIHFNWRKEEWITTTKEQEHYKFWSDMITGTHNNANGVPKKGIKYIEKTFKSINPEDYNFQVYIDYINYFGEMEGIQEFYKNFYCLRTPVIPEDELLKITPIMV